MALRAARALGARREAELPIPLEPLDAATVATLRVVAALAHLRQASHVGRSTVCPRVRNESGVAGEHASDGVAVGRGHVVCIAGEPRSFHYPCVYRSLRKRLLEPLAKRFPQQLDLIVLLKPYWREAGCPIVIEGTNDSVMFMVESGSGDPTGEETAADRVVASPRKPLFRRPRGRGPRSLRARSRVTPLKGGGQNLGRAARRRHRCARPRCIALRR